MENMHQEREPADRADWVSVIFKDEQRNSSHSEENLKLLVILDLRSSSKTFPI